MSAKIFPTNSHLISQEALDTLNGVYAAISNKEHLRDLGGIDGLISRLGVNPKTGLSDSQVEQRKIIYGDNSMPETPPKTFTQIFLETFSDTTILILIAAALVSIIVNAISHPKDGWVEGTTILVAVAIIAMVSSGNDYSKQLQFKQLELSSQRDERSSVLRNGVVHRINPNGIVVGDILLLQPGDSIPADCVLLPSHLVCANIVQKKHHHHHHHGNSNGSRLGAHSSHSRSNSSDSSDDNQTPIMSKPSDYSSTPSVSGSNNTPQSSTPVSGKRNRHHYHNHNRHHHHHHHHHKKHDEVKLHLPMMCDESSLTGESEEIEKSSDGDCFLLSSCLVASGSQHYAVVISTGVNSQWGKIKTSLVTVAEDTPLQMRLASLATSIGSIGVGVALATFAALTINALLEHHQTHGHLVTAMLDAFIMAVIIIVIAVPEGLPLAVTISLAYSSRKMYKDQCFVRVLSACETMGNATTICSDKTGTLTESSMTVQEGWLGGAIYHHLGIEADGSSSGTAVSSAAAGACAGGAGSASDNGSSNNNDSRRNRARSRSRSNSGGGFTDTSGGNLSPGESLVATQKAARAKALAESTPVPDIVQRILVENICANRSAYIVDEFLEELTTTTMTEASSVSASSIKGGTVAAAETISSSKDDVSGAAAGSTIAVTGAASKQTRPISPARPITSSDGGSVGDGRPNVSSVSGSSGSKKHKSPADPEPPTRISFRDVVGNKTEASLLRLARKWGFSVNDVKDGVFDLRSHDKLFEFNSFRKRSTAIVHRSDGSVRLFTKGASEWVFENCTMFLRSDGLVQYMDDKKRQELKDYISFASSVGLRTLCLAHKDFSSADDLPQNWYNDPPDSFDLCCDAILGISDPLREDADTVVGQVQRAGIKVRMITGDNLQAACAVARQCGILKPGGLAMEGSVFRTLSPTQLDQILPRLQVMARSSPTDKLLLVCRLNGHGLPADEDEWMEFQLKYKIQGISTTGNNSALGSQSPKQLSSPGSNPKKEYIGSNINNSGSDRFKNLHSSELTPISSPGFIGQSGAMNASYQAPNTALSPITSMGNGHFSNASLLSGKSNSGKGSNVSNKTLGSSKSMGNMKPVNKLNFRADRDRILPGYLSEWMDSRPEGGEVVSVTGDGTNDAPALKAADVGLAMGVTGTKVAQASSDIVILDDKFSTILNAILWGRCIHDNIRKFVQFQLTVNIVALILVFTSAVANYALPLNAVQMLWVNLIMDTLGALALAIELPGVELLDRKPYKKNASLICKPMWRNIIVQSAFQLSILFVLLFHGAQLFDVPASNFCVDFHTSNSVRSLSYYNSLFILNNTGTGTVQDAATIANTELPVWNLDSIKYSDYLFHQEFISITTLVNYFDASLIDDVGTVITTTTSTSTGSVSSGSIVPSGGISDDEYKYQVGDSFMLTCNSFYEVCGSNNNGDCFEAIQTLYYKDSSDSSGTTTRSISFSFDTLQDYDSACLSCNELDNHLVTIIFNTFVFCQIFNEYTARSIYDEVILFQGLLNKNPIFLVISFSTMVIQILIVQFGGKFLNTSPLTANQWLSCIILALFGIPVGIFMRFIPIRDDPRNYHSNAEDDGSDEEFRLEDLMLPPGSIYVEPEPEPETGKEKGKEKGKVGTQSPMDSKMTDDQIQPVDRLLQKKLLQEP